VVRTGYYHKNNVLKFRILEAAIFLPFETFTTRDIEAATGIDFKTVGGALGHYHKVGITYFRRMPKKGAGHGHPYRWKITKKGIEAYLAYLMRIRRGFDLNRRSTKIKRMPSYGKFKYEKLNSLEGLKLEDLKLLPGQLEGYIGITKRGAEEMGITENNLTEVAGLSR
jgi:hypothetical protein